jgi:hypothetical protein
MATMVFTDKDIKYQSTTKTGDFTASEEPVIFANATSGNIAVTLPPASSHPFKMYSVKKTDSSANTVTITPSGSDTIDGQSSIVLTAQYMVFTVISDGTNWHAISSFSGSYV